MVCSEEHKADSDCTHSNVPVWWMAIASVDSITCASISCISNHSAWYAACNFIQFKTNYSVYQRQTQKRKASCNVSLVAWYL